MVARALTVALLLLASSASAQGRADSPLALDAPRGLALSPAEVAQQSEPSEDDRFLLEAPQVEARSRGAAGPVLDLLCGAVGGTASAAVGMWLGDFVQDECESRLIEEVGGVVDGLPISINDEQMAEIVDTCAFGGSVGFGVHAALAPMTTSLGVLALGAATGGRGRYGHAFAGGLLGSGIGSGAYYLTLEAGGSELAGYVLHSVATLAGSMLGYELSHRGATRNLQPGLAFGPEGGALTLSGRF